jgi:proteasome lid subunit RPN8/RPN11
VSEGSLVYRIPGAGWALELPAEAVRVLQSHAQRRWWSSEAAGQLFSAAPGQSNVRVHAVTKLPAKAASRTGLRLDIPAVIKERQQLFARGLHCLGFWHSHPEPKPSPSPDDTRLAEEHARAGWAAYAGLVFIIVGTAPAPDGLGVWVHDGTTLWRANHEEPNAVNTTATPLLK